MSDEMQVDENKTDAKVTNSQMGVLISLIVAVLFLLYYLISLRSGYVIVTNDLRSRSYQFALFVLGMIVLSNSVPDRYSNISFYISSTTLLVFSAIFLLSLHSFMLLAISVAQLAGYSRYWYVKFRNYDKALKKLLAYASILVFMYLAGNLIHVIVTPFGYTPTISSIDGAFLFQIGGVPLLMGGGIVFNTPLIQGSISPLSFLLFALISSILTENYFGIFRLLSGKKGAEKMYGTAYGAVSLLSCQCESGISLLPTMAVLLITTAMIPILFESFFLLLLTNYLINSRYIRGARVDLLSRISGPPRLTISFLAAIVLLIGVPVLEVVGIYLNLISNIFFFFGIGTLMVVSAYFEVVFVAIFFKLESRKRLSPYLISSMFIAASFLMFIWYVPHLTELAVEDISAFLLMNLTSIGSGLTFGLIRIYSQKTGRQLLDEFIALMFGMPPIIIFYISALAQTNIWSVFGITEQIEFGIIMWAAILPFMWLTTNVSLNGIIRNSEHYTIPGKYRIS